MGGSGDHIRAVRTEITGWSKSSAANQRKWLWTVEPESLTGYGYAATLTVRDLPPSASDFHTLRTSWLKRLDRMGATRVHWVIEWQERGVPHIHAAVYFDRELSRMERSRVGWHWVEVAGGYGASGHGQDVKNIEGALGWLKYLAKHASRGASHYQRSGHPDGWERTGRLWGHTGDWPVIEPLVLDGLNSPEFYRVRRMLRAWSLADARKVGDWRRVRYLRSAGRPNTERMSRYQGVSEWIPEHVVLRLVDYLEREARESENLAQS